MGSLAKVSARPIGSGAKGPAAFTHLVPVSTYGDTPYSGSHANLWSDLSAATDLNVGSNGAFVTNADFGAPISANFWRIGSTSVGKGWALYGSNDNSNWTLVVPTTVAPSGGTYMVNFTTATYRYWRAINNGVWNDPHSLALFMYA